VRFFHSLTDTETRLRESAHPRYQLEIGLVKLVEMRRLAPLGEIIERLNALEESLGAGARRAPAGGAGGQQTQPPPASSAGSAGAGPRRGSAVGGRRGSSSFSADSAEPTDALPTRGSFAANAGDNTGASELHGRTGASEARGRAGDAQGRGDADARTQPDARTRPGATNPARTATPSTTPALKLVPAPSAFSGGTPSFAGDAASRADEAPFALGEATPPDAGRDQVGLPVALVTSNANTNGTGTALAPDTAGARADVTNADVTKGGADACDVVGRIKRGLEERGKPLLAVAFDGARRVRIEGDEVRVEFAPEGKHLCDTLKRSENLRLLREVCCEVLGRGVGAFATVKAPGEGEDDAHAPEDDARREQRLLREQAEGHPDVQRMLKTFRAEIVDVRRTDDAPPQ